MEHITDINWLTIISDELAEYIGGIEKSGTLGKDFPISRHPPGYVIQAGGKPELATRKKGTASLFMAKYKICCVRFAFPCAILTMSAGL